jgi:hypothetical protein
MAESSPGLDRRTTKTRAVIFGAVRSVGYARIGEALGVSESTACEYLQKHGDRIALLLTALGHKPVPVDVECHSPKYLHDLRHYAAIGIQVDPDRAPESPTPLWEDEP